MADHLLSIDCGTQSIRALIFDARGNMPAAVQKEYAPYVSPKPGLAEQDPELFWQGLIHVCQTLKKEHPELMASLAGMGVAAQRDTMINVDKNGQPLRPAIVWMDQRRATPEFAASGLLGHAVGLAGVKKRLMDAQSRAKCNWLRQNEPDIWQATHKYLQVSGFLNFRLTSCFNDFIASQIGHVPFDYKKQAWARSVSLTRRLFPIASSKLPELVAPGKVLGYVTADACEQTGIPKGLPVIACGSDKGCETLGNGVTDPSMVSLSFGTMATVQTTSPKYFEAISLMPPYPAPMPGHFNPEVEIYRGFWMISWFKNQFAHKEVEEANARGTVPEKLLDQCLQRTPPGAMGLVVQPYWGPGLERPGAKGAMIGFGDVHTRDHIYRAVIEGLCFALKEGMEAIQAKSKIKVKACALSGGASQSAAICRIAADVFNLPMQAGVTHETSGLGAAVVTAAGTGIHPDIKTACELMTRPSKRFEPDPAGAAVYDQLYHQVYKKMYHRLSPLYKQIQTITGYP